MSKIRELCGSDVCGPENLQSTGRIGEGEADNPVIRRLRMSARGLLVQLAGLGDLIMALPAIHSLQAALPCVQWTLLTRPGQGELIRDRMNQVISMPWPPGSSNLLEVAKAVVRLRRTHFDFAINLYSINSLLGGVAMKGLFLGIRPDLSIGRSGAAGWRLFDVSWEETRCSSQHEVDLNLAMIQNLGVPGIADVPTLQPAQDAIRRAEAILGQHFGIRKKFVAIFPGGARQTRHWPTTNYRVLATWLHDMGIGVCVVGGEADRRDARSIADAAGSHGLNLVGQLSLQELVAVLSLAAVYVGNDSGPTHVAAAVGTPCIALFGPGDPVRIHPRGPGPIRLLRYKVECSPCYVPVCHHHTCMRSLTLESVCATTMELLGSA